MIDTAISWLIANPLQAVALLAATGIGISLLLFRHFRDVVSHHPPRC